jgi:hypothetical protein
VANAAMELKSMPRQLIEKRYTFQSSLTNAVNTAQFTLLFTHQQYAQFYLK